jgi:hypothetical protein
MNLAAAVLIVNLFVVSAVVYSLVRPPVYQTQKQGQKEKKDGL